MFARLRFCFIYAPLERAGGAAKTKRDCWIEKKKKKKEILGYI